MHLSPGETAATPMGLFRHARWGDRRPPAPGSRPHGIPVFHDRIYMVGLRGRVAIPNLANLFSVLASLFLAGLPEVR